MNSSVKGYPVTVAVPEYPETYGEASMIRERFEIAIEF
jgi:hypothetical protein